jgi:hypothetical protein
MEINATLIKIIYDVAKEAVKYLSDNISFAEDKTVESLQNHIVAIERWSGRIQFFGIAQGKETDLYTRALRVAKRRGASSLVCRKPIYQRLSY